MVLLLFLFSGPKISCVLDRKSRILSNSLVPKFAIRVVILTYLLPIKHNKLKKNKQNKHLCKFNIRKMIIVHDGHYVKPNLKIHPKDTIARSYLLRISN